MGMYPMKGKCCTDSNKKAVQVPFKLRRKLKPGALDSSTGLPVGFIQVPIYSTRHNPNGSAHSLILPEGCPIAQNSENEHLNNSTNFFKEKKPIVDLLKNKLQKEFNK